MECQAVHLALVWQVQSLFFPYGVRLHDGEGNPDNLGLQLIFFWQQSKLLTMKI